MKRILIVTALLSTATMTNADVPHVINYQGRLLDGTNLVNENVNMWIRLYTNQTGGVFLYEDTGTVSVVDGLYSTLIGDTTHYGSFASAVTNNTLYLEVVVNNTVLSPRERVSAVAYALVADSVRPAGVTATMLAAGSVTSNALAAGSVTESAIANATIQASDLNIATFSNTFWKLDGNAGTEGTHFLGTTDNRPFEIRANNLRAVLITPVNGTPNIVLGASDNVISNGTSGASVLGGSGHTIAGIAQHCTIGGGNNNAIGSMSTATTVAGGSENHVGAFADHASIGGGRHNSVGDWTGDATIAGGSFGRIDAHSSGGTIGGGMLNALGIDCYCATVAGGYSNAIGGSAVFSAIFGGFGNAIDNGSEYATVAGGLLNSIESPYANIAGGSNNRISAMSHFATIAGGERNSIGFYSGCSALGGGNLNSIGDYSLYATIGGGNANSNGAFCEGAAIVGGNHNSIGDYSLYATIGGGDHNRIGDHSYHAVVAAGAENNIHDNSRCATIAGGYAHNIGSNAPYSTIGGGAANTIGAGATYAYAAGYRAEAKHAGAFVWADSQDARFSSTATNQFLVRATGGVGINKNNPATAVDVNGTVTATALVVDSGNANDGAVSQAALTFGFASGEGIASKRSSGGNQFGLDLYTSSQRRLSISGSGHVGIGTDTPGSLLSVAQANSAGRGGEISIVNNSAPTVGNEAALNFAVDNTTYNGDSGNAQIKVRSMSASDNRSDLIFSTWSGSSFGERMRIQSDGKIGIGTNAPVAIIHVAGGAQCNGSTWQNASDRNLKENFRTLNNEQVLTKVAALPISEWNYKSDNDTVRHIGPTAQDFHSTFGLGDNDTTISTIDPAGVSLAAIQALHAHVRTLEKENTELKAQFETLKARLEALEAGR